MAQYDVLRRTSEELDSCCEHSWHRWYYKE